MKPRIKQQHGAWVCQGFALFGAWPFEYLMPLAGWGATPKAAYAAWKRALP